MIPRYNRPNIEKIWTLENKFKIYGRWNIISHKPYIISDGCHNIDASIL